MRKKLNPGKHGKNREKGGKMQTTGKIMEKWGK